MTLPIPVYDGDPQTLQFILERLAMSAIDTGGRSIKLRWGTGTLTFAASTDSAHVTVTHGMGSAPVAVAPIASSAPTFNDIPRFNVDAFTSTTFGINGQKSVANSTSVNFLWIAIG